MTHTTLEQSKALMNLGLDEKTADLYYQQTDDAVDRWEVHIGKKDTQNEFPQIHCWSAEALLQLLPTTIYNDEGFETHKLELSKDSDDSYTVSYSPEYPSDYADDEFSESGSLVDVLIKACSWLLEYNYI